MHGLFKMLTSDSNLLERRAVGEASEDETRESLAMGKYIRCFSGAYVLMGLDASQHNAHSSIRVAACLKGLLSCEQRTFSPWFASAVRLQHFSCLPFLCDQGSLPLCCVGRVQVIGFAV